MYAPDQQYRLLDIARAADQSGVDFIDTTEHVLMGLNALHSGQGWDPHHLEHPQPEALITLAAMAGATRRIKLSPAVVVAAIWPADRPASSAAPRHARPRGVVGLGLAASWV